jgi:nitronate monooxygenase
LLHAREDQTILTRAFSGRMARGLSNEFIERWNRAKLFHLSYPWQNALTQPFTAIPQQRNLTADTPHHPSLQM